MSVSRNTPEWLQSAEPWDDVTTFIENAFHFIAYQESVTDLCQRRLKIPPKRNQVDQIFFSVGSTNAFRHFVGSAESSLDFNQYTPRITWRRYAQRLLEDTRTLEDVWNIRFKLLARQSTSIVADDGYCIATNFFHSRTYAEAHLKDPRFLFPSKVIHL